MFGLFKKKVINQTPEQIFWEWFVKNKSKIEKFIENPVDFEIYNTLTKKMKAYNELLFPELMIDKENNYVLIITPDGLKDGVLPTKRLGESHPVINKWKIKKFRQPNNDVRLELNGIAYPSTDILIKHQVDLAREKVDIEMYIKNMNIDEKGYQHLAFLYLDHILGEFNTITRVGHIDFKHCNTDQTIEGAIDLLALRKIIDKHLY